MTNSHPGSPEAGRVTPPFAWMVLACLGVVDLVRGFLHTFLVEHSAVKIAGLNLAHSGQDQLLLLGSFGISNFLTGAIFIAVACQARQLVPTVLALIPLAYLLGFIALRLNDIAPEAAFPGRAFMLAYAGVCVLTFVASVAYARTQSAGASPRPESSPTLGRPARRVR
ncbi:MAG: hypothetical protein HYX69_04905 [Planctomycetia bacterium]|nr:hypothetical protein [Planctomycetia bacterium]